MYYFRTKASGYHISGGQDIIDLLSAVFTQKSPSIFLKKILSAQRCTRLLFWTEDGDGATPF
jgi:hypothetical protein